MNRVKALFLVLLLFLLVGCQAANEPAPAPQPTEEPPKVETPAVETPGEEPALQVGFTEGSQAPDFTLKGLDGETYTLSDYKGKPVQLIFWSVGCVYCMMELPELQEFYQAEEGYEILALNATFQDGIETVKESVDEMGLAFPVLLLEKAEDIEVAMNYNVSGIPHNVFIDKEGIIEKVQIGMTSGEEAIKLLKELTN